MKLTVKNIRGDSYALEATGEETTRGLKEQLRRKMGEVGHAPVEPECMKMIYKGRHLEDEKQLREYQIADNDTIIVMTLKKHTAPAPAAEQPATMRPESAPLAPSAPVPPAVPLNGPGRPAQPTAQPAEQLDPSNEIVQGSMHKAQMVEELAAMGFPAAEAERALLAAFYNRDRAVDYLLNGIPDGAAPAAEESGGPGEEAESAEGDAGGQVMLSPQQMAELRQLVSTPEFVAIQQQVSVNPSIVPQLLAFLRQNRPLLAELFDRNPRLMAAVLAGQFHLPGEGEAEPAAAAGPGETGPELSSDDRSAIAAMQSLGFSEQQCLEAYLICERNQELALNYLLDEQGRGGGPQP